MKKDYCLFIAFYLLCNLPVISQDQYAAGRVYLTSGDTLPGLLNSQLTARYVKFKAADNSVTEYVPNQLTGFERNGIVYLSKEVETNLYGEKVPEPLFMEQLVGGRVSLYHFKEKNNEPFFYAEKEGKMMILEGGKKLVTVDNEQYFTEDKRFQIILQQLFSDCAGKSNLHETAYTKTTLAKAVYTYNRCVDGTNTQQLNRSEKMQFHPGIRTGINSYSESSSSFQLSPSAGVFVNLPLGKANRIFSGQVELNYNQYKVVAKQIKTRYDYIDFTTLIKGTYPKGRIRPFGAAGFAFGLGEVHFTTFDNRQLGENKVTQPKLIVETGIQVPLGRRYIYAAGRYEDFINTPESIRSFNFSLGFAL